jgi:DNA-binding response OmpR family regulator
MMEVNIPRIDPDFASRDALIDHIYLLENLLSDAAPRDHIRLQVLGLSPQQAVILSMLMTGRLCTKAHLRNGAAQWNDEIEEKIVVVQMHRLKKVIARFGASVQTVWGVGYRMTRDNIDLVERAVQA